MVTVDARGSVCPYPIVELGRAAAGSAPGTRLRLLADDPVALTDVPAWCRMKSAQLTDLIERDGYWEFLVVTGD